MGFEIKFPKKPDTGKCGASAPLIYNWTGTLAAGTPTTVAAPFDPPALAPLPGTLGETHFATDGCDDLILRVVHYDDADPTCDNCPAPTTVLPNFVESFVYIPRGTSLDLPGYIVDYDFVNVPATLWTGNPAVDYALAGTLDGDGNPIGVTVGDTLMYVASCRAINKCCLLPEVTIPEATPIVIPSDEDYLTARTAKREAGTKKA